MPSGPSANMPQREAKAVRMVGVALLSLGLFVAYESIEKLYHGTPPERSVIGLVIALVSLLVMPPSVLRQAATGSRSCQPQSGRPTRIRRWPACFSRWRWSPAWACTRSSIFGKPIRSPAWLSPPSSSARHGSAIRRQELCCASDTQQHIGDIATPADRQATSDKPRISSAEIASIAQ